MKIATGGPRRAFSLFSLVLALSLAGPAWAADDFNLSQIEPPAGPMCAGQKPLTEKELAKALEVMNEIIALGGQLSPGDEETFIRGQGLSSDRMNCLLGKFMAGNDLFGWGSPAAYGVGLTADEAATARKFAKEGGKLRKYLEESLNVKAEPD